MHNHIDKKPTYYEILGLGSNATSKAIKSAYHKLALQFHPDRVPDKEEEFKAVSNAYAILIDPVLRHNYDRGDSVEKGLKPPAVFEYFLDEADIHADHYTYYNQLFRLKGDEQIKPEMKYKDLPKDVFSRLFGISQELRRKEDRMTKEFPYEKMNAKQRAELKILSDHLTKIYLVGDIINNNARYKELYDLSLGVYHGPEFYLIEDQLGGRDKLIKAIEYDKKMHFTNGVFALYQANCLTPCNFGKLRQLRDTYLSSIACKLVSMGCLTQANFDLVCRQRDYAYRINCGLGCLKEVGLANEEYFHYIVQAGEHAFTISETIKSLKKADILNQETLQMALKRKLKSDIAPVLSDMKKYKELTQIQAEIFRWEGPQEVTKLIQRINQMFTHGLFLLTRDFEKGKIAMRLALDLKQYLKKFIELPKKDRAAKLSNFQKVFKKKLHSQDEIMSEHREYWKVIIANILIALTGFGLVALGANYAINGRCFFAKTKREKLIDNIECSTRVFMALTDKSELDVLLSGVEFVDMAMVNDELEVAAVRPSFTCVKESMVIPKDNFLAKALECLVVKKEEFIFSRKSQKLFLIGERNFYSDLQRRVYDTVLRKYHDLFNSRFSKDFWLGPLNYNITKFSELRYRYACLYYAFEVMYLVSIHPCSAELALFKEDNKVAIDIFDYALFKFISSIKDQAILFPIDSHIKLPEIMRDIHIVTDINREDDGSYTVERQKKL